MAAPHRQPLEIFLSNNRNEIIDFVNSHVRDSIELRGGIFDRLVNQVLEEYRYGPAIDNMHRFLADTIAGSLWCGWFSQARTNANDPNFTPEFVQQFQTMINRAYELGREFAPERP